MLHFAPVRVVIPEETRLLDLGCCTLARLAAMTSASTVVVWRYWRLFFFPFFWGGFFFSLSAFCLYPYLCLFAWLSVVLSLFALTISFSDITSLSDFSVLRRLSFLLFFFCAIVS